HVEAELHLVVVLDVDLRQLAVARLSELLLHRVLPADRLEHADGPLPLDDAAREARDDLLVGAPRPGGRERRDRRMPVARRALAGLAGLTGVAGTRLRRRRRRDALAVLSATLRRAVRLFGVFP